MSKTTAFDPYVPLESNFLAFINDNDLIYSPDLVLLAVSGGLDSVVLAELFKRTGLPFAMAHVNFGLRGEESDADELLVKNKALTYGVPFHSIRFDTATIARERSLSIQMAARDLRYTWFAELLDQHGYACVATAHHQNDVLETMLLNLSRGTGLAGLHGIASHRQHVIRPLLFATREQIAAYATARNITYREDSSNLDDKYARNRIRHHVVPVMTELNPGLWHTLPHTVARLQAAESLMQTELLRSWQDVTEQTGEQITFLIDKLLTLTEPNFRLAEWLKPYGFTESQARQIMDATRRTIGQVFTSITHRVTHERVGLVLEPLPTPVDFVIQLSDWSTNKIDVADRFELSLERIDKLPISLSTDPNTVYLDADRLEWPLTLRPWRQGDRFQPLGLRGRKLVSDLLNEHKVSRSEREQTVVLLSGEHIAWVIGRRIDHRFRITAETRQIVRLRWSIKS